MLSLGNQNLGALTRGFLVNKEGKAVGRGNRDFHIRDNLNAILGELRLDGRVLNAENELVGTLGSSGDIISAAGEVIARARPLQFYEAVKRQPIYDKDGNIIGYVSPRLQAVDAKGRVIGRVSADEQQLAVAADGRVLGHIDANGNVLDKDGKVIGKLQADGSVVDGEGNVIGMAGEKRKLVYDKNNKVIGYVDAKGKVLDFNGNVLGEAVEGGEIVDARGNVIGQLNKDGSAISLDGSVIGNTKLNWYEKPQPAQPAELPEVGAREVADVGQFKRSLNIALTPDGEYLGDILEDGNVVDKKGTVIGKLLPDGLIVDGEGSLIGIEEAAKKADTGEMFGSGRNFRPGRRVRHRYRRRQPRSRRRFWSGRAL